MSTSTAVQTDNPVRTLTRRWPAVAGAAVAAGSAAGMSAGSEVAPVVAASGFVYLGAAALRSPVSAWPLFLLSSAFITVGRFVPGFDPTVWMLATIVVLTGYAIVRGALRPGWGVPLQLAVMVVLGATALAAVAVNETVGGLLVAAGLFAHAGWDVYHHRADRVVARSMAEFCFVLDTLLAVAVLVVTLR
jgi:hypothetical protein